MKRTVLIALCIVIINVIITNRLNHSRLQGLARQLANFPVPDGVSVQELQSVSGSITGRGDGTDYLTALLVYAPTLSREELLEHYNSNPFKPVLSTKIIDNLLSNYGEKVAKAKNDAGVYPVSVYVNDVTEGELKIIRDDPQNNKTYGRRLNKTLRFKELRYVYDYTDYYFVILYDEGYPELLNFSILFSIWHSWFR
ncbi:MAG: hypothetical protein M0R40_00175 [Firmicutes bacterium]|nr:hypothetical protein [Bacillota bacterium]